MKDQPDTGDQQAKQKLLTNGADPSVGKATQFKKGQSGNPKGRPKGSISLSTRIQNMMNDEEFEIWLIDNREGWKQFKGAPAEAIIKTAMLKAMQGDARFADWLAKYGWGTKIDVTSGGERIQQTPIVISQISPRMSVAATRASKKLPER